MPERIATPAGVTLSAVRLPEELDMRFIEAVIREARPVAPAFLTSLQALTLPKKVDFTPQVTLQLNQDGAGGCGMMATLHVVNILKKRALPYSPDLSYRFASYVYNQSSVLHEDSKIESGLDQVGVMQHYGSCPEPVWPSDFDPPANLFPDSQRPSEGAFTEADLYKISSLSAKIKNPDAALLRMLLFAHGPLVALSSTHVFALIGYDDDKQAFRLLNSWGDGWGQNGMLDVPYDRIANPLGNDHTFDVGTAFYITDHPTSPAVHPFTARIRVHHTVSRRFLTVTVDAVGQTPLTVWDKPNQNVMVDTSKNLEIDVPLPDYAHTFWPPSDSRPWQVTVHDSSPGTTGEVAATIEDVILVQRAFDSAGKCIPLLSQPSALNIEVLRGESVTVYIPARRRYFLTLTVKPAKTKKGATVEFTGSLLVQWSAASNRIATIPLQNATVTVHRNATVTAHRVVDDPIESYPLAEVIGTTTTDQLGRFTLQYSPATSAIYAAMTNKRDGSLLAISHNVILEVV